MRTISVRLDDQTDAALLALCGRHGYSQTDALKEAIMQMASRDRPTPGQLARELGLIGAFRSGDGDVAQQHSQRLKDRLRARRSQKQAPGTAAAPSSAATRRAA